MGKSGRECLIPSQVLKEQTCTFQMQETTLSTNDNFSHAGNITAAYESPDHREGKLHYSILHHHLVFA